MSEESLIRQPDVSKTRSGRPRRGNQGLPAEVRFWLKVNKNGPCAESRPELGPCWLWTGGKDRHGRGVFSPAPRRGVSAHKYLWEQLNGPAPEMFDGQPSIIGHACGNASMACVNPGHLFLGCAMTAHEIPTVERFWSKVGKDGPPHPYNPELGVCWTWKSGLSEFGYGNFYGGKEIGSIFAHRFSWQLVHGEIPPEMPQVLHGCDRPSCSNPTHLFLGTQLDNIRDMDAKGRRVTVVNRGPDHHLTKFTEFQRRTVVGLRLGGMTWTAISDSTGISKTHVARIFKEYISSGELTHGVLSNTRA